MSILNLAQLSFIVLVWHITIPRQKTPATNSAAILVWLLSRSSFSPVWSSEAKKGAPKQLELKPFHKGRPAEPESTAQAWSHEPAMPVVPDSQQAPAVVERFPSVGIACTSSGRLVHLSSKKTAFRPPPSF